MLAVDVTAGLFMVVNAVLWLLLGTWLVVMTWENRGTGGETWGALMAVVSLVILAAMYLRAGYLVLSG